MESVEYWQALFESWPDAIQRKGSVVTKQGESVPFVNFLISGGLLLIERDGPDASGARKFIVSYESIAIIKLATAAEMSQFQVMGFQATL